MKFIVVVFIIFLMSLAAISNISISPRMLEWHEPDSEYIGHIVSKTIISTFAWHVIITGSIQGPCLLCMVQTTGFQHRKQCRPYHSCVDDHLNVALLLVYSRRIKAGVNLQGFLSRVLVALI